MVSGFEARMTLHECNQISRMTLKWTVLSFTPPPEPNVSIESQNVWRSEKKMFCSAVSRCSSQWSVYGRWEIRYHGRTSLCQLLQTFARNKAGKRFPAGRGCALFPAHPGTDGHAVQRKESWSAATERTLSPAEQHWYTHTHRYHQWKAVLNKLRYWTVCLPQQSIDLVIKYFWERNAWLWVSSRDGWEKLGISLSALTATVRREAI